MRVSVVKVPYDSGYRNLRMGLGPGHILDNGLRELLHAQGIEVSVELVESPDYLPTEIKTTFELCRLVSERVRNARRERSLPVVLFGNCNTALGTLAGTDSPELGVIWFDAHGDFNTPETTSSGFLDGMGLATAAGLCWRTLATSIPGFQPIPARNMLLVGGRDFDPQERIALEKHRVSIVSAEMMRNSSLRETLEPSLDALRARTKCVYIHVDLDVLDPTETPANQYLVPNGLSPEQVEEAIQLIGRRFTISASGVGAYAPEYDKRRRTLQAAFSIIQEIIGSADHRSHKEALE